MCHRAGVRAAFGAARSAGRLLGGAGPLYARRSRCKASQAALPAARRVVARSRLLHVEVASPMTPLLVLAEFRCSEDGDAELRRHLERTLQEARAVEGCLQATVWERSVERRYLFT